MDVKILQPLRLCLDTFNFLGLKFDKNYRWKTVIGMIVNMLTIYAFVIGELNHMSKADSLEEIVQGFSIFSSGTCVIFKTIHYMKFSKPIEKLYENLKDIFNSRFFNDQNIDDCESLKKEIRDIVIIFKIFIFSSFSSVTIFFLTFFVQGLVYDVMYPFDITNWIGFWIAVVHQSFTSIYVVPLVTCLDSLPVLFIGYATGIMNELAKRLESSGSLCDDDDKLHLEKCIEVHKQMKELVIEIQNNFSGILFIQGFISSTTICSNIFLASMVDNISTFLHGLTFCVSLSIENFIYCYFGQNLMNSSEKVSNSVFHSEWYKMKLATIKNLKMFMENLKNPLRISIYGVYDLNLMMFQKIIHNSYSMFTVLRSMNDFK
jgi:hypothetical protein